MEKTSMQATIQQWVDAQRSKDERKRTETLANTIIERTMEALQKAIDEEMIPEKISFSFNPEYRREKFIISGLAVDVMDIRIPSEEKGIAIGKKIRDFFKTIPSLNVETEADCDCIIFNVSVKSETET